MKALNQSILSTMNSQFIADPKNRMAMDAVTKNGIDATACNYNAARRLQHQFSITIDDGTVTNQKRSGRCWLFSSLNVARSLAKKNLNLDEFEFSQAYAMYFDKLERTNYFLQDMADLLRQGEPIDGQLIQYQLGNVMGDGGQWTMAMNIYKKYGAVPKSFFPETASSENTAMMNTQLKHLLHKCVMEMAKASSDDEIEQIITSGIEDAHRLLTIHLGNPPENIDWEWTDKDGEFHRAGTMTPQEFWNTYVGDSLDEYICLIDDPRHDHPKGQKIAIEHLGNIVDGDPTEYLNVDIQTMKDCVRRILSEKNIPVWFGADCHPFMDRIGGSWSLDLFDYKGIYNSDFTMSKEDRVCFGDSAMNHAMAFVGVNVLEDGTTNRWRVENSWGSDIAHKGYFTMDDDWFTEYVYEVAVPKSMLSEELQKALEKPAISLPAWDPMGALAE